MMGHVIPFWRLLVFSLCGDRKYSGAELWPGETNGFYHLTEDIHFVIEAMGPEAQDIR